MGVMEVWAPGQIDCDDMKLGICFLPFMVFELSFGGWFCKHKMPRAQKENTERFGVFGLLRKHQVLMHGHVPAAVLLFLMDIRIVAMGEAFPSASAAWIS